MGDKYKVGVVGGGVVGSAIARCFMEYADVRVYDRVKERSTHGMVETVESDVVFLCLPTPQMKGGLGCDTSAISQFFEDAMSVDPGYADTVGFCIRSTVPVGFTDSMRARFGIKTLDHSPEFLTARCALTDAQVPARNIVGGRLVGVSDAGARHIVVNASLIRLYEQRFPGTALHIMTSQESEAVKLFLNSFFAVKVAFFNEVEQFAEFRGMSWSAVLKGILSDGRVAQSHCNVPGPDGQRGFGGACLPKDIASLISQLTLTGLPAPVMRAALERNKMDRGR